MMKFNIAHWSFILVLLSGCSEMKDISIAEAKSHPTAGKRAVVGVTYKAFFYPVAVNENATQETVAAAQKFSKFVTLKHVSRIPSIGGCFFFVDVSASASEPDGYLIVLRDTGGMVIASNTRELDRAFKALENVARYHDGKWLLPMPSVITSYRHLSRMREMNPIAGGSSL